ncbi:unnamed protein product [Cyprideis torosa]|uniref:Uncharacterized protein n=1 Tax=Cyprideis torosa TaxID=163714 RepID=A0A7R8X2Z9_9CRUS|nr:unnamed protein product [Cyprideis torosa]CAG0911105.1 unnamed protein product [Cyprideis torosa]
MPDQAPKTLVVGKISGVYGIKGWVKVYSWTQPRENVLTYPCWQVGAVNASVDRYVEDGKAHGKGVIAKLKGCDSCEDAEALIGQEIRIFESELKSLGQNEYYWRDLIGLDVINLQDEKLGTVKSLMETGANNVLVVKGDRERLVPWVMGQFVKQVDLQAGTLLVDWDIDF